MAIVKGRRAYDSEKLAAVAAEDDRAAAEYVWMMSGISDDWGRFRTSQRAILGRAYLNRPSVTEADIQRWLVLYEQHGLMRSYSDGGIAYGEWTNYMGHPESRRRYHSCPEPPWTSHTHRRTCEVYGGGKVPCTGHPYRSPVQVTPTGNLYRSPSVVSVVPVLSENERTTDSVADAPVTPRPSKPPKAEPVRAVPPPEVPAWNRESADLWAAAYRGRAPGRLFRPVQTLVRLHTWERVRPVLAHYFEVTQIEYVDMAKFAAGFGEWEQRSQGGGRVRDGPRRQSAEDVTVQAVQSILRKEAARRGGGDGRLGGVLVGDRGGGDAAQSGDGGAQDRGVPRGAGERDGPG